MEFSSKEDFMNLLQMHTCSLQWIVEPGKFEPYQWLFVFSMLKNIRVSDIYLCASGCLSSRKISQFMGNLHHSVDENGIN